MKTGAQFTFLGIASLIYGAFLTAGLSKDYPTMALFALLLVPAIGVGLCLDDEQQIVSRLQDVIIPSSVVVAGLSGLLMLIPPLMTLQPTWMIVGATQAMDFLIVTGTVLGLLYLIVGLSISITCEDWRGLKPLIA